MADQLDMKAASQPFPAVPALIRHPYHPNKRPLWRRIAWWLDDHIAVPLVIIYGVSVVLLLRLDAQGFLPVIYPDEGQYAASAENLLLHGQFLYRGDVPLLIPPGYPMLVAFGRLLFLDGPLTLPTLILNHALMIAVIFPVYGLAREIGLSKFSAVLIGVAAVFIPDLFYADLYMAEPVFYFLFALTCYFAVRYFKRPGLWSAVWVGLAMGAALVVKNTGLTLVVGWGATLIWGIASTLIHERHLLFERRHGLPRVATLKAVLRSAQIRAILIWPALALLLTLAMYYPWAHYRSAGLGQCPNCSGELGDFSGLLHSLDIGLLVKWGISYSSDMFLAVSVLAFFPFVVGLVAVLRESRVGERQAVYLSVVTVVVIGMAATYSGYLAGGQIRDRHMFSLIPLILVLACKGIMVMGRVRRPFLIAGSLATGAALLAVFNLVNLPLFPGWSWFYQPWQYGLMATVHHLIPSDTQWFTWHAFYVEMGILLVGGQVMWLLRAQWRVPLFALLCLVVFVAGYYPSLQKMEYTQTIEADPYSGLSGVGQWLNTLIGPKQRIIVLASRGSQQPDLPGDDAPLDLQLQNVNYPFGPDNLQLSYLETAGLDDLRLVPQLVDVPTVASATHARYLLSPLAISGLTLVGHRGVIMLYDLSGADLTGAVPSRIYYSATPDFYHEQITDFKPTETFTAGNVTQAQVTVRNLSHSIWDATGPDQVALTYRWRDPHSALVDVGNWVSVPDLLPSDIQPGQRVTMTMYILAPPGSGTYRLDVDMEYYEGAAQFEGQGATPLQVQVLVQ